ncbi:MAG TPA: hypothetical protein VNO21_22940, partial [Polyangiaceae bacterium]|nr:hypothetical protein [Polyangiaceae bacterium]
MPLDIADRGTGGEPGPLYAVNASQCDPLNPVQNAGVCRTSAVVKNPATGGHNNQPDRSFGTSASSKDAIDPDLKAPSTSEISAGGEYEIVKNGRFGATYTRR